MSSEQSTPSNLASSVVDDAANSREIIELAYSEGKLGLKTQENALSSFKQTASGVLVLNSLAFSILGGLSLRNDSPRRGPELLGLSVPHLIALVAFTLCVLAVMQVWGLRSNYRFHSSPTAVISQFLETAEPYSSLETKKIMAKWLDDDYKANDENLSIVRKWLVASFVLTLIHYYFWILAFI